jgi:hypothetical protein
MKTKLKPFLILNEQGPVLVQALHRLREQIMPAVTALELSSFLREAVGHSNSCLDARNAAVRTHGKQSPAGPSIEPGSPEMEKFLAELNSLAEREVDLTLKTKIRLPATIAIKASDWDVLEEFFELDGQ